MFAKRADRAEALHTIQMRLVGARYELEQALTESRPLHLAAIGVKLDRALLEISSALRSDALSK